MYLFKGGFDARFSHHSANHLSKKNPIAHVERRFVNLKKLATILSYREYYTDAFYKIALWQIGDFLFSIEDIQQALRKPKYCLYLGRKSCPLGLPLNPQTMSGSLKKSFDDYAVDSKFQSQIKASDLISYYWDKEHHLDEASLELKPDMTYIHRDHVRSRHKWQFSNREEFYYGEQHKTNEDKEN